MGIILGILIGIFLTSLFTQSYRRTLIISHFPTSTGISTCVEEVGLEVVMPNLSGVVNDPQVQNMIVGLIVMMFTLETLWRVKV